MNKPYLRVILAASLLTCFYNGLAQFIPGGAPSVGLTNLVPDVPIWYDSVSNRVRLGPIIPLANQLPDQGNWEPWVSVVGEKVFLIQTDKYADDGTQSNERYTLAFQPARAGTYSDAKLGECFYDDAGKPYTNQISSRQDGNPGRVYGDRRYGGTNFVTGGEANPQAYPTYFNSDGRFATSYPVYNDDSYRCGLVQCFSLDLTALKQTPLCKAFDAAVVDCAACLQGPGVTQRGRLGGGLAALDNGNFVALIDDRSMYWAQVGNTADAAVFKPDGTSVKGTWMVDPYEAWTDPCAFKGGFCVRLGTGTDAELYFYDNSGTLVASNFVSAASGLAPNLVDTGRGDNTKIAGDIRTPWVYYTTAGWLTVWNGTNGAYVTNYQVIDDLDVSASVDVSDVACDSLGNICVVYDGKPTSATDLGTNGTGLFLNQVMARVLHFDGKAVTPLTHTFFAFINHDSNTNALQGYTMSNPNVDMTTKYICVAAKGSINSTNNPTAPPDSALLTTVYTIINNPGWVAPTITATYSDGTLLISWPASAGDATLQSTSTLKPTAWGNVTPQPPTVLVNGDTYQKSVPMGAAPAFFRLGP